MIIINYAIENMVTKFEKIKKMGWIKSIRKGTTGVGATFENLIGIDENQSPLADYYGIEIKTKRQFSKPFITLFNLTPKGKTDYEIKRIHDCYAYTYRDNKKYKVLNNSANCTEYTKIGLKYYFKLNVDYNKRKIFLCIYNINKKLIDCSTFWSFDSIENKLMCKDNIIAYIESTSKFKSNIEYFKYDSISFYKIKNYETFFKLIEKGKIRITFKIGVFLSGKRIGEIHDHGTGFDIDKNDIELLYNKIQV